MGKDLGLQSSNERYLAEFVELWNALVINPAIWNITGGANVALNIQNGHRVCRLTPPAGTTSTIGTILGFNVQPDEATAFVYVDQLIPESNIIKKLTIEFMMRVAFGGATLQIGLNDLNGAAIGQEAIFFEWIQPAAFSINTRRGGATTSIALAMALQGKYRIEIKRGRVDFFQNDILLGGRSVNLPFDYMYFWVNGTVAGGGNMTADMYPIYIRYELL